MYAIYLLKNDTFSTSLHTCFTNYWYWVLTLPEPNDIGKLAWYVLTLLSTYFMSELTICISHFLFTGSHVGEVVDDGL